MEEETAPGTLLPIGRFSEMTRLSVKALRLYDEMGLLKPAFVDGSSGYRYYTPGQANRAEAIRMLRGIDMPLDEIQAVLDSSPERANEVMGSHKARLAERLAAHERMLTSLSELIDGRRQLVPYDIEVKKTEDLQVASLRVEASLGDVGEKIGEGFGTLMHAMTGQGAMPAGAPLIVYHDVLDEETAGTIELCVPVAQSIAEVGAVVPATIKGGPVAATIHKGKYSEVGSAYHALSTWMGQMGHTPTGPPREIYLNDPTEVTEDEQLTEVNWPIDAA